MRGNVTSLSLPQPTKNSVHTKFNNSKFKSVTFELTLKKKYKGPLIRISLRSY